MQLTMTPQCIFLKFLFLANVLSQTIQLNFSSDNHSPEFQRVKIETERTKLELGSDNSEAYNDPITMCELVDAIQSGTLLAWS